MLTMVDDDRLTMITTERYAASYRTVAESVVPVVQSGVKMAGESRDLLTDRRRAASC